MVRVHGQTLAHLSEEVLFQGTILSRGYIGFNKEISFLLLLGKSSVQGQSI